MFRVLRKNTPDSKPMFFMLCDDLDCGLSGQSEIPPDVPLDPVTPNEGKVYAAAFTSFIQAAGSQGWLIRLDKHFCPRCKADYEAMRQQQRQGEPLVQIAQGVPTGPLRVVASR